MPIVLSLSVIGRCHLGNSGWSRLCFPFKLPGVLALGATILVASFFLVSFAEWVRRRGAQSDKATLEGL